MECRRGDVCDFSGEGVLVAGDLVEDLLDEDHADVDALCYVGQELGDQVVDGIGCVAGYETGDGGGAIAVDAEAGGLVVAGRFVDHMLRETDVDVDMSCHIGQELGDEVIGGFFREAGEYALGGVRKIALDAGDVEISDLRTDGRAQQGGVVGKSEN